jgi:hypothetical protein
MRKTIGLLLAAAVLAVGTANAQPIRPGTPSIARSAFHNAVRAAAKGL